MSNTALKLVATASEPEVLRSIRLPTRPALGPEGRAILALFR